MLQTLHTHCIFLSIAGIRPFVECGLQAGPGPDLFQQLRRPQIPGVLPDALKAIQDGRVLCPAQFQGQHPQLPAVCTGAVKLPHPAQVPGRRLCPRGSLPGDTQRPSPPFAKCRLHLHA